MNVMIKDLCSKVARHKWKKKKARRGVYLDWLTIFQGPCNRTMAVSIAKFQNLIVTQFIKLGILAFPE